MSITDTLLLRSLVLFLLVGSVAGLLAGVALILRPEWLRHLGKFTNRWVSTRHLNKGLERPINVDMWFYRYSKLSGTLMMAGAIFIIYFFITSFDKLGTVASLFKNSRFPPALLGGLLDGLVLVILVGGVLALIVGLFLIFRPSLLRGFEQRANHTASLRRALKPLEIPRSNVDEYVFRHVQLVGVLLVLGSVYTLVGLAAWLD